MSQKIVVVTLILLKKYFHSVTHKIYLHSILHKLLERV